MLKITVSGPADNESGSVLAHSLYSMLMRNHYYKEKNIFFGPLTPSDPTKADIVIEEFSREKRQLYERGSGTFLGMETTNEEVKKVFFRDHATPAFLTRLLVEESGLNRPTIAEQLSISQPLYAGPGRVKNFTPENWPEGAPAYISAEGWEFEKATKIRELKNQVVTSWFSKQPSARHLLIANRLKEISL